MKLETGAVLAGRYRLDAKLGEGGMGVVWAATHEVTRQKVALKLLLPGAGTEANRFVKRFMREARAASAVRHPNVVVVYDVMELDEQTPMMVMELLRGESLGQRLDRDRVLPLGEVARVLLPVVSALGTAHLAGVVHRDVKPDNIFLAQTPEGMSVKVLDFGVAKLAPTVEDASATLTATNAIVGTPYYMAPEQVFGDKDIDDRADIWALGVIAYECLAGVRPAVGDNVGQIMKIIATNRIVPIDQVVSGLPSDVTAVIMGALSFERKDRPRLTEMKDVLARYTDVRVPDFTNPLADTISKKENPAFQATSDPALSMAPTVASGEVLLGTLPTVATDAGVTRLDRPTNVRWFPMLLGALAVSGVVAGGVFVVTRSRTTPPASSQTATSTLPSVTASASTTHDDIAPTPSASIVATPKSSAAQTKPIVSVTAPVTSSPPPKTKPKLEQGGVVDTVPY